MILKVAMGAVLKCVSEWKMNFGEKQLPSTESNKKKLGVHNYMVCGQHQQRKQQVFAHCLERATTIYGFK